ncbi:hypothetical protein [Photorhabdus namnaonensis]|nr:hypothetical protein [Photorhabdus namnaonensis]
MSRNELVELIRKIQRSEGTEEEADKNIDLLCNSVLDPMASNYIFYDDLSAEEIVDKILSYKPISL